MGDGADGAGKSTLLSILAGADAPSAVAAVVDGWDLSRASRRDRVAYRRDVVGVIFQQTARNLVPYLGAAEVTWREGKAPGPGPRVADLAEGAPAGGA